jgi:tetratricopeptide (TPR) repeat protein
MTQRALVLWAAVAAVAVGGAGGCAKDAGKPNPYAKAAQRQQDDASGDDFGTKKEPAINATTHLAAGSVAESQGEIASAINQYQLAVKRDPALTEAWYRLASLQARVKQYEQAIGSWKGYLNLAPNDANAYANLGFTCDLSGRTTEAEAAYQRGIAINPKHPACRINYGLQLTKNGRIDEAKAQFGAVLAPAAVHYNIASVYEQQGKVELAREQYQTALGLNPRFHEAKARLEALNAASRPVANVD